MEYSEYHEKKLALESDMSRVQEEYDRQRDLYFEKLGILTAEYLGDLAVGKAVKYDGKKYFVEKVNWIADNRTVVHIRSATKDGSRPNPNGKSIYSVEISELEAWNEL